MKMAWVSIVALLHRSENKPVCVLSSIVTEQDRFIKKQEETWATETHIFVK